jgi:transposase
MDAPHMTQRQNAVLHNSRDFAAWTGLTPGQKASGHKSVMLI